jgi:GMP synthase (glutamine-hydrolysing)
MIAIIDFGSQYTQLIARRVREKHVFCKIFPPHTPAEQLKGAKGILLSGGPDSVYKADAVSAEKGLLHLDVPILGICYGMQWMVHALGGRVRHSRRQEYGRTLFFRKADTALFEGVPESFDVWMSHADKVCALPKDFVCIGSTASCRFAAIECKEHSHYGLQFHPEVSHTDFGDRILENFLFKVCGCKRDWSLISFVEDTIKKIREEVGGQKVLCALSGGVDSCTTATLVHKAVGDQLICIFVDNGLLRKGERELVQRILQRREGINIRYVDAKESFLKRLKGIKDPEKKRQIIGEEFVSIFSKEAKKIKGVGFLAQGTLYPDVIESCSTVGPSAKIKTHHNVGGLPSTLPFRLIEPLRLLFKDEVRKVARMLHLPPSIVWRHPFPGPGLAVRVIGEVTERRLNILREADSIVDREIRRAGLYRRMWQAFVVLLPLRTVGVMGDRRTYEYVIAIRCVRSQDGMTADVFPLSQRLLSRIATCITNEVKGVNRVVYDVTSKPPATIEWE